MKKLSEAQERVMLLARKGETFHECAGTGKSIYTSRGGVICFRNTIDSLVKVGLLEQIGKGEWKKKGVVTE